MPYTTINKGSSYFNTVLYTGNGTTQSITGVGFQPDLVWLKSRNNTYTHLWYDIIRGAGIFLQSPSTNAEGGASGDLLGSFNTDGFQVNNTLAPGTNPSTNGSGATFVGWNWLGSNTTTANTSGTISSTVSVNQTAGFSIVSYTGDGVNNRTVGHGLGATPKFIIIKNRSAGTAFWSVINPRSTSTSDTNILYLNRTDAEADDTNIMGTNLPNSTTFGIGNYAGVNVNAQNFIAYCFAPIKGYSAMGQYTGNGSTDGTFIYTGFKPAYVMAKASSTTGQWSICDNKRGAANILNNNGEFLFAESTEATNSAPANWDFVSNGLKARAGYAAHNSSGVTYIYMAFAENPFVTSGGIPVTAI
jgi:hypothetical protein